MARSTAYDFARDILQAKPNIDIVFDIKVAFAYSNL